MIVLKTKKAKSKTKSKFNNIKCEFDGYKFDSKAEREYYKVLRDMLIKGEIFDLKNQVTFQLNSLGGKPLCKYIADFTYNELTKDGQIRFVVVDVKSKATITSLYKLKRKAMLNQYNIAIKEIIK